MNAASVSIAGMTSALTRFDRASNDLMQSFTDKSNVAPETAVVDLLLAETQFTASLAAFRAADDMYGALLDIKA